MPRIYVAPGVGSGNGSGPGDENACATLNGINWRPGTEVLIRRGTRLYLPPKGGRSGLFVPAVDGLRISHYGDAESAPVLIGASEYGSGWAEHGGGLYSITGPKQAGVTLYHDEPLPNFHHAIPDVLDQLRASTEGGYLINGANADPQVYVKLPDDANPNDGDVAISSTMIGIEHTNDVAISDLDIDGLEIMGFSRQGMNLRNVTNSRIRNNSVHATGGDRTTAWYVGGCIQCTGGCNGIDFYNNHVYDCYDSPFSTQLPSGNDGASIQNITYKDNLIDGGWALAGIEIASWVSNGLFRNIRVENNRIHRGGTGFSGVGDGPRGPHGVIVNANRGRAVSNNFENVVIHGNYIADCPGGGIYVEHANIRNSLIECNTVNSCGTGGPRGRAGPGSVRSRGGIDIQTGEALDQGVTIASNEVSDCRPYGIRFEAPVAQRAGVISNNTLCNNGDWSIELNGDRALPAVRNNIAVGAGIRKSGDGSLVENNNNVSVASVAFQGFSPGTESSLGDPGLVDLAAGDLQLAVDSQLIGTGRCVHTIDCLGRAFETPDLGCYANKRTTRCTDLEALTRFR